MPEGPPKPKNAFGQELPLRPEQDYPGQIIQALLGTFGLGDPQARSNLIGQLLGAAVPFVGATKRVVAPIKAYHASPHDFDSFDMNRIGTGQGAASYGHGLYFAENPATKDQYIREFNHQLSQGSAWDSDLLREYFKPGRIVQGYGGLDQVIEFRQANPDQPWSVVVQRVRAEKPGGRFIPAEPPRAHATAPSMREVQQVLPERVPKAKTYEVNIHADPATMLDWEKTLKDQPHIVKAFRDAGYVDAPWPYKDRLIHPDNKKLVDLSMGGEEAYRALTDANKGSRPAASEALLKSAVPGIKYLDQGSRGFMENMFQSANGQWFRPGSSTPYPTSEAAFAAAEAAGGISRNYVLFSDQILEITKKYGISLPFASLLAEKIRRQTQPDPLTNRVP